MGLRAHRGMTTPMPPRLIGEFARRYHPATNKLTMNFRSGREDVLTFSAIPRVRARVR